jgi:uncharacterized protein YutD
MKNNFWIITMHNSNSKLRQVTLSDKVLSEYKFYVIGFVPADVIRLKGFFQVLNFRRQPAKELLTFYSIRC